MQLVTESQDISFIYHIHNIVQEILLDRSKCTRLFRLHKLNCLYNCLKCNHRYLNIIQKRFQQFMEINFIKRKFLCDIIQKKVTSFRKFGKYFWKNIYTYYFHNIADQILQNNYMNTRLFHLHMWNWLYNYLKGNHWCLKKIQKSSTVSWKNLYLIKDSLKPFQE